jgi:cephalosporin-C deacetylase-like acetyl esterase
MRWLAAVVCLAGFLLINGSASAMMMNVPAQWGDTCSPPQRPEFAFFSAQSETMLFAKTDLITILCQSGLRSVNMRWTLARNMFAKPFLTGQAEALPANRFRITLPTAKLYPGFYDLRVTLDSGKPKLLEGLCTFGYRVEKMAVRSIRPADFTAFWDKAKASLATIPLKPDEGTMQSFAGKEIDDYNVKGAAIPGDYDPTGHKCEEVESGKVSFAGPDGGRVYGWLAKPKGPGPFPVMLVLPGAGVGPRTRPLEHARHGYLALDIQIHGLDVDLKEYPRMPGYNDNWVFEPTSGYYFYNVYLRALQAINYLASRPDADMGRFVVAGGSQGGHLSVVMAALDKRVVAALPGITASANMAYWAWSKECNKENSPFGKPSRLQAQSDGMDLAGPPPLPDLADYRCYGYYDPMSFAPDVRCPVLMNSGLIDRVSPASQVFGVYAQIGAKDKQIIPLPGLGHDWSAEFDRRAWRWLEGHLQKRP